MSRLNKKSLQSAFKRPIVGYVWQPRFSNSHRNINILKRRGGLLASITRWKAGWADRAAPGRLGAGPKNRIFVETFADRKRSRGANVFGRKCSEPKNSRSWFNEY
jgi:hypothetical protein